MGVAPYKALALLEPLPSGPELVSVLTEAAATALLQERHETGLGYAERALSLAGELGLPRPARALGFRGMARSNLGERGGLDDFREAITLATKAGQGREVALLHNNLAVALWPVEGPAAVLEVLQAGIAFAQARGLTEMADTLTANTVGGLVETGEHEQALTRASSLADQAEASGNLLGLAQLRAVQAQILALRGQATQVADTLDWLESTCRETGSTDYAVLGFGAAAPARAALGHNDRAAALLTEIDSTPGLRENATYAAILPTIVRTALTAGDQQLAARLAAGVEPHTPYHEHALTAANAARRWQSFGVVPEQAFALLGQGRCLTALGRPNEASQALRHAREIFHTLQAAPALAETDLLLQQATALSS